MEIVLLGATGSLGSAIKEEILRSQELLGKLTLNCPGRRELDLLSPDSALEFFQLSCPDVVIDASGQLNIGNAAFPNLEIAKNLIAALEFSRFKGALLRFGSTLAYGTKLPAKSLGFREIEFRSDSISVDAPPLGLYAQDKRLSTLETLGFAGDFKVINLILSNLYVPERLLTQSTRKHVIPSTVARLSKALTIGNSAIQVPSPLHVTREFTHVGDIASWIISQLNTVHELPSLLNLGSGQSLSMGDLNQKIASLFGASFTFEGTDGDSPHRASFSSRLDSGLARNHHEWNPREDVFANFVDEFPDALGA
jgi:nucleoside-diphosphate-sugar epimerase